MFSNEMQVFIYLFAIAIVHSPVHLRNNTGRSHRQFMFFKWQNFTELYYTIAVKLSILIKITDLIQI